MGVDTDQGCILQYSINAQGALTPGSPASLSVTYDPIALASTGSNLYALTLNSIGPMPATPGGNIYHFVEGSGGALSMAGTTALTTNYPIAMTAVSGN
jgi:hypothetical protein